MVEILKISDVNERRCLQFDLVDLVSLTVETGSSLAWMALPMNGETFIIDAKNNHPVCKEIEASETGVSFSWQDLTTLAEDIRKTIWGTFVGFESLPTLPLVKSWFPTNWHYLNEAAEPFYTAADLAFQAVDSAFWLVYAKNPELRSRIRDQFKVVQTLQRTF